MLISNNKLTAKQFSMLKALRLECRDADMHAIPIYEYLIGETRALPCNVLYYQQEKLVGFLGAFFFYTNACEISLMVAPGFRRKTIASQMLQHILPLLIQQGIQSAIFSSPQGLYDKVLSTKGFTWECCEYQMLRDSRDRLPIENKGLNFRKATVNDLATLCAIDNASFQNEQLSTNERFLPLLYDKNYTIFLAEQKEGILQGPIGKAHIYWQEESANLADVAIIPQLQGRGLGTALLVHAINHILNRNKTKIYLNVETLNKHALTLYTKLGFTIHNAYDYWRIPIEKLAEVIHYEKI